MNRYILMFLMFLVSIPAAAAAAFDEAETLFNQYKYKEAMGRYEEVIKTSKGEPLYKALYRKMQCQSALFEYENAFKTSASIKDLKEDIWVARFAYLKILIAQQYLQRYRPLIQTDMLEEGAASVEQMSQSEIKELINNSFDSLWKLRKKLVNVGIDEEKFFAFNPEKNPKQGVTEAEKYSKIVYPTLWDTIVQSWITWLSSQTAEEAEPDYKYYLTDEFKVSYASQLHPKIKTAVLMQDAYALKGGHRVPASELWLAQRYSLALNAGSGNVQPLFRAAVSGQDQRNRDVLDAFKKLSPKLTSPYAKAYVLFTQASTLYGMQEYEEALALCKQVAKDFKNTPYSALSANLEKEIIKEYLDVTVKNSYAPAKQIVEVKTRNINTLYFNMWKVEQSELIALMHDDKDRLYNLSYVPTKVFENYAKRKPSYSWQSAINYDKKYHEQKTVINNPDIETGIYIISVSNNKRLTPESTADGSNTHLTVENFVNISDITLLMSMGPEISADDGPFPNISSVEAELFRFYAVNAKTGKLESGVTVKDWEEEHSSRTWKEKYNLVTDSDGYAAYKGNVSFVPRAYNSETAFPVANKGIHAAYFKNRQANSFSAPANFRGFLETDRPIYRPEQTVEFKATLLERVPYGFKVAANRRITVYINDANYSEVYKQQFTTDDMGAVTGSFKIEKGRLLGNYSINASMGSSRTEVLAMDGANFAVEEYKLPEFEVKLNKDKTVLKIGEKADISGNVNYYSKEPVANAQVRYKITRVPWMPWWRWHWFMVYNPEPPVMVASGQTVTDDNGNFSFNFTPFSTDFARFKIEADVTDQGGRTINDTITVNAGTSALNVSVAPSGSFFVEGKEQVMEFGLFNLNEGREKGEAFYEVYRINKSTENIPAADKMWNTLWQKGSNGEKVAEGKIVFSDKDNTALKLNLTEGFYRVKAFTQDPWGQTATGETVVLCLSKDGGFNGEINNAALAQYPKYRLNETANILLGDSNSKGDILIEIWRQGALIKRDIIRGGGVHNYKLEIEQRLYGNFMLRWASVYEGVNYGQTVNINVEKAEKLLTINFKQPEDVEPGAKVAWNISVADNNKKPADGQMLLRVYDRALEYYAQGAGNWTGLLYNDVVGYMAPLEASLFDLRMQKMAYYPYQSVVRPETVNFLPNIYAGFGRGGATWLTRTKGGGARMMAAAAPQMDSAVLKTQSVATNGFLKEEMAMGSVASEAKADAGESAPVRSNFAETALFAPVIKVNNGKAQVNFTMPEQLSSWKVSGYAITADAKVGTIDSNFATAKKLQLRLQMPRFLREGDKAVLGAVLTNNLDTEITATVKFALNFDGKNALGLFGVKETEKTVKLKAKETSGVWWNANVPYQVGALKANASVRSTQYTDGEEKTIAVLPSRQRLIATDFAVLEKDASVTLNLAPLQKEDATRIIENSVMRLEPQGVMVMLNSLPYLLNYPYKSLTTWVDRFVPLAITNEIYTQYPKIKAQLDKLPKRAGMTPAWQNDDPIRQVQLVETPWVFQSGGMKYAGSMTDMLNADVVSNEKELALSNIKKLQNSDGGFGWFSGGISSLYMTLYYLSGMAEATRFNVEIPEKETRKALNYALNEINVKRDKYLYLYGMYVLSSFNPKWSETRRAFKLIKEHLKEIEQSAVVASPITLAYIAQIFNAIGDKAKADEYLDRILDASKYDKTVGVYWAPEAKSWLWYNDNIVTQAFMLKTLMDIRPKAKEVPEIVKWLMLNRKGTMWKSTTATAKALFSLIEYMAANKGLDEGDSYVIKWNGKEHKQTIDPFYISETPFEWTAAQNSDVKNISEATVDKKGPNTAFASLTAVYSTTQPVEAHAGNYLSIKRTFFKRYVENNKTYLKELKNGDSVKVGDEIKVDLEIESKLPFEYVHIKDPKGAGFEADTLRSGWTYAVLARYEEPRDTLMNFFMPWIPAGKYNLTYTLKASTAGEFKVGSAVMQSMYAPEFSAYSNSIILKVEK